MSNEKIASITVKGKADGKNYSLITIWAGKFPGTYSVSLDNGTDKYPAIDLLMMLLPHLQRSNSVSLDNGTDKYPAIDLLKAIKMFASKDAYVNVRVESEVDKPATKPDAGGRSGGEYDRPSGNGAASEFDDGDVPF